MNSINSHTSNSQYSGEYRGVLANETTLALDDEPGTTTVDEQAPTSFNEADDSELTLFLVPIGGLSKQTRFVLSTAMTLFFYGATEVPVVPTHRVQRFAGFYGSNDFFFFFLPIRSTQCCTATCKSGCSANRATISACL